MNLTAGIEFVDRLAIHQTFVTKQELIQAGIDEATVAELIEQDYLIAQTDELYTLLNSSHSNHHTRVLATYLIPEGIICLGTALSFYELTPLMPFKVHLALPFGYSAPKNLSLPIAITKMPRSAYADGIETHYCEGRELKIYNIPKTIVDCFIYPWTVGMDNALKAVEESLFKNLCTADEIMSYADKRRLPPDSRADLETALQHPEEICLYT